MDDLRESPGQLDVGLRRLHPEQVGVGRVGEPAGEHRLDAGVVPKKPSGVRVPSRNGRSRSSTSLVMRLAASESVRAMMMLGTPATSAARRAALSVRMCCEVGISTLPPMCPHFFSLASWSSQCTPAAPAAIMEVMSS